MLDGVETDGLSDIVSWQPHGKAFRVHNQKEFSSKVLPNYFEKTKFRSFQRQLHIYGFLRIRSKSSPDYNAYYHPLFQRGNKKLCEGMKRQKIKGGKGKEIENDFLEEPNFYATTKSFDFEAGAESLFTKSSASSLTPLKDFVPEEIYSSKRKTTHQSLKAMLEPISSVFDNQTSNEGSSTLDWLQQARSFISSTGNFQPRNLSHQQASSVGCSSSPLSNVDIMMQSITNPRSLPTNNTIFPFVGSNPLIRVNGSSSLTFGATNPLQEALFKQQTPTSSNVARELSTNNLQVLSGGQQLELNTSPTDFSSTIEIPSEGEEIDFGGKSFFFTDSYTMNE